MKLSLLSSMLLVCSIATAQVGINTTNPQASLDIIAADNAAPQNTDGLLIPRLNNLPATNPTATQQSMLVYLAEDRTNINISGTAQDYNAGFYYWDNTIPNWVPITPRTNWRIDGNDNVISGTHFIGTTNAEEVDFRVNNKFVGRLTELGQFELQADDMSVFIGFEAGEAYDPVNTAAEHNTFLGYQAGKATNSGRDNTAMGTLSLTDNTTGNFNTGVGDETLENNTTGDRNTAVGNDALRQNQDGDDNTAIGQNALRFNTSGDDNTAIGKDALINNTVGDNNIAIGNDALANIGDGNDNIAIGTNSDITNVNVRSSIVIGTNTQIDSANNINSVALGHESSIQGTQNTNTLVIGSQANITASDNQSSLVIGHLASMNGINGNNSVVIGPNATNTSAATSITIGVNATTANILGSNTSNSIAMGSASLVERPSSIAIGNNASVEHFAGRNAQNAIAIGTAANSSWSNSIALGNNATTTKANQLRYGNITEIDQGTALIVNTSDGRFKYDIQANVPGLDFINRLRPVTYKFDLAKLDAFHNAQNVRENSAKIETGFIAQEVEKAMLATNYDFSGLVKPTDLTKDNYKVSYVTFVVPLVQAVQEQQETIELQHKKIELLESRLRKLESLVEGLK